MMMPMINRYTPVINYRNGGNSMKKALAILLALLLTTILSVPGLAEGTIAVNRRPYPASIGRA